MKIEILGTGCAKCITLEKIVHEVVSQLDGDYEVVKVDDIVEIMKYQILSMPGFVIDGKLISSGKVLSADEIRKYIQEAEADD
ncbi:MAG: thioredoxin family protein [Epsilonproteobacteria bacterium]|nr:thioredoxin family protein [Campylobacterota bacterium]